MSFLFSDGVVLFPIFMSNKPMAVQKSSRTRQMMLMNMPMSAVMPIWATDMAKPPSRPPNWRGRKKRRLAKRFVKERMNVTPGKQKFYIIALHDSVHSIVPLSCFGSKILAMRRLALSSALRQRT